jgi:rhamnosyl/mannosyltransferase
MGGPDAFLQYRNLSVNADLIHQFFPWPFADMLQLTTRPRTPLVVTYISDVVRQRLLGKMYAPLMWKTLREAKVVVANSPAYAQTSEILTHPSVRDKVRIIPLGIDEDSYAKRLDQNISARIGLTNGEPFFLFLGVLRYYKGVEYLLHAAKHVDVKIVIAGSGPDEQRLRALRDELNLNNVVFAGQVTDGEKVFLLQFCCGLVLPSHLRSEAFGMVLVEGAMFEKPLISCEIGTGTSYVNADGETGMVVPPESADALAAAMNTLAGDESLARKMGKAARVRYKKLFSGHALGKAYYELYKEVID